MKVHEIIELLQTLPQDLEVVVSSDNEGNSFRFITDEYISVEKFDEDLEIYHKDDYHEDLINYVCIG